MTAQQDANKALVRTLYDFPMARGETRSTAGLLAPDYTDRDIPGSARAGESSSSRRQ